MTSTSRNSGAPDPTALERVLRQDRLVVIAALTLVVAIAWGWLIVGAGTGMSAVGMTRGSGMPVKAAMSGMGNVGTAAGMRASAMNEMAAPSGVAAIVMTRAVWTLGYALLMVAMWWVMMVAMMLPSAAPMLLLFARVNRNQKGGERPYVPTAMFAAGYLLAWGGFSAIATLLQWALERMRLLSPMMVTTSWWLGGAILLLAGLWQLTPAKNVCLRHCRSPLGFLMQSWCPGRWGALRMGLEHGSYCLGCCWFLMGLLFFGGVMNLFWIAGLALFVLLEKTVPAGLWVARAAGIVAVTGGVAMLVGAAT